MNKILKLDFNERSDKVSPLVVENTFDQPLWCYPDRSKLEMQIAELNQLQPEQVLCTNGGDEAIMLLMRIIKESAELILPLPAFSQYTWGQESWQLKSVNIAPKDDLSIDIDKLLKAIEDGSNNVIIITRPNNPTGEFIDLDSLTKILEAAKKRNSWVFLDEAYIEFSEEYSLAAQSSVTLLSQYNNLVILRTFSKAFGLAGIRLGYILGSPQLIEAFTKRCMPFNVPQPSLSIAASALTTENIKEVKQYCQTIIKNRQQLSEWLLDYGIKVFPSQANFVAVSLPEKQAQAVKSFLAKNNILVRSFNDSIMQNCLRITIPFQIEPLLSLLQQALRPGLICLDMDGVLIDTSESYELAIIETVEQLSGNHITRNQIETLKNSGGFNNDWVLTWQLLKDLGQKFTLEEVTNRFQSIYLGEDGDGLMRNEKPLIQSSFIEAIKSNKKDGNNQLDGQYNFAVVTGRPRFEAKLGTKLLQLENIDIVSLDDVQNAKPSPEGINQLQRKYSSFSWMCGDNPDDMQAANASNSLAIGIGSQNAETLYQAGADVVLNSINELEDWLWPTR